MPSLVHYIFDWINTIVSFVLSSYKLGWYSMQYYRQRLLFLWNQDTPLLPITSNVENKTRSSMIKKKTKSNGQRRWQHILLLGNDDKEEELRFALIFPTSSLILLFDTTIIASLFCFCFCLVFGRMKDMKLTMRKKEKNNLNLHLSKSLHHTLDSCISDHPGLWTIILFKFHPMG